MKLAFQNIFKAEKENAEKNLTAWYNWVMDNDLKPMKKAAKMVRRHWDGILEWFNSQINNGVLEGLNSLVQAAKAKARGYRTFKYLRIAIYLIAGKLDLPLPT